MDIPEGIGRLTKEQLQEAMANEGVQFQEYYNWLDKNMSSLFFEEVERSQLMLIAHNLMGFPLQDHFTQIHFKNGAIVICLDSPDADLRILKNFNFFGIKNYQTFVSKGDVPFESINKKLRIAILQYTEIEEDGYEIEQVLTVERIDEIYKELKERNPDLTKEEFDDILCRMNHRFMRTLSEERLILALHLFLRAKTRDHCQYEVKYNEDWKERKIGSVQIVLAWRNTPKYRFLYRLAKMIHRHGLKMRRVNATYINPYGQNSILLMSIGLNGTKGKAAWEVADMQDFLQEMVTLKYFEERDSIESTFVDTDMVRGNMGNFLRCAQSFIHQFLLHADLNLYSLASIEEGLCRHPELTKLLCEAFELKFHPVNHNIEGYDKKKTEFLEMLDRLDTGQQLNDTRRKNILKQGLHFIEYTLKTNFYRNNKSAISFRLDPQYLDQGPFERAKKFPELPFAIFFIKGMSFIGFHIRFQDLSRGGLRTVIPQKLEQMVVERNNVFAECYNLAYTQQKKNKDIPEGGSKGVIFIELFQRLEFEAKIYIKELNAAKKCDEEIKELIDQFRKDQILKVLYQSQRAYVHSMMTLINCNDDGSLKARDMIVYYDKPEYIYMGPDENMHNVMIEWIAAYAKHTGYKPGRAFISSKPSAGINHKEFGVTSLGVNVYMHEVLLHLGIDPEKDPFSVKITGGPDGDVAGNQMLNLLKYYPNTAKLVAITDVSGTINDPKGLDLKELSKLFYDGKPINCYPPKKLSEGGFLLDTQTKRDDTTYSQQTLCYRKTAGKLEEDWLSGNDMNHLFRFNVHQTPADIFIPAGGRPRTLNGSNYSDFLDETGQPTSKAIIEAANLYLTNEARYALEEKGVLIIKDSSANKGGVICSSCEVQTNLIFSPEEFQKYKPEFMDEILDFIKDTARREAQLLLRTYEETDVSMIDISDFISEKINTFMYQILDHLQDRHISNNPEDPLTKCLLKYSLPLLRNKFGDRIISELPDTHKKAMISCYIASKLVYEKGLQWSPTIVDILPLLIADID